MHGGTKSICYYSITDLRNTAFISILDNFSLDHCHWVSHSESKCQAFLYKAARCSPQSRIKPLFSPLFLPSPTVATYHRFCPRPTLGSSDCSSPPPFPCLLSLALAIIASILSLFNIGLWRLLFPFLFLSSPPLSRFGHHRIDSVSVQHWVLATALLSPPFPFLTSSLPLWLHIIDLVYRTTLSPGWLSSIRSLSKSGPQTRSSISQHSLNRAHRLTGLGFGPTLLDISPFAMLMVAILGLVVRS